MNEDIRAGGGQSIGTRLAIKELVQTKCCAGEAPTELVKTIKSQISTQNIS